MVGVTLVHRQGYFFQRLDRDGHQSEEPSEWVIGDFLTELPERVMVTIKGRETKLRCWLREVIGRTGFKIPVYFLNADLPDNPEWHRTFTDRLYGGGLQYRLCQEMILGIGGIRMLRALGHTRLERFHMNEGHSESMSGSTRPNRHLRPRAPAV